MAKLTTAARKQIPTEDFAVPGRKYPIEDASHARNALSRVSANGTPTEKAEVKSKVKKKYPSIGEGPADRALKDMMIRSQAFRTIKK